MSVIANVETSRLVTSRHVSSRRWSITGESSHTDITGCRVIQTLQGAESHRHYRVVETHVMPGRAASGGVLAPELAAHHRGRTRVPMDLSQHLCPLFSNLFEIGRLLYLRSDFNSSQTDFNSMSEFQIGRLLWEDFRSQIRRPISDSTSPGWRDVRFQKRGENSGGDETSDVGSDVMSLSDLQSHV